MPLISKLKKLLEVPRKKDKEVIFCKNCKIELMDTQDFRCPRCFALVKHTCTGCGSCNN